MQDRIYTCPCGQELVRVKFRNRTVIITRCIVWGEDFLECPASGCKKHLPYPSWWSGRPRALFDT